MKVRYIGLDPASPDGDYACATLTRYDNGELVIEEISHRMMYTDGRDLEATRIPGTDRFEVK